MNTAMTVSSPLRQVLLFVAIFIFLFSPFVAFAQPSFGGQVVPQCEGGRCGYCDLVTLAERVIEFLIFFGIVVAILMIIYAGFLYLTAGSNAGQVSKAHSTLRVAIFGLVIVLAAWLIINLIVTGLGVNTTFGDPWTLPGGCP